jgi:pyruvate dehydrogenase E2 component (dihydrolipoamide acetyltransferase)
MVSGNLGTWQKKVGDEISAGDILVEIETDKAQMDFESQEEGFLAKILVQSGTKDVSVNTPIAVMVENEEDVKAFANYVLDNSSPSSPPKNEASSNETSANNASPPPIHQNVSQTLPEKILASPVARKLASEIGISLSSIIGTGPRSRITKHDVLSFSSKTHSQTPVSVPNSTPSVSVPQSPFLTGGSYVDIPLSNMRKTIASRLQESKSSIPHYYLTMEISMDKILE